MPLRFATTFLCHAHAEADLAQELAHELGRRGVLAWLDAHELRTGDDLGHGLPEAIQRQDTLTLILSSEAAASTWVRGELEAAIAEGEIPVFPVFLGDPKTLVQSHPLLRSRWLDPLGRVKILGEVMQPNTPIARVAAVLAAAVVRRTFSARPWFDAFIIVDQRGDGGSRRGRPALSHAIADSGSPALVFRPDLGERQTREVRTGVEWQSWLDAIDETLGHAIPTSRLGDKRVHLAGEAQLGIYWHLGRRFDRTSGVPFYVHNHRFGTTFDTAGISPLGIDGGNADCAVQDEALSLRSPRAKEPLPAVGLQLARIRSRPQFLRPAREDLQLRSPGALFLAVDTDAHATQGEYVSNEQVRRLVADVVALVRGLATNHGTTDLYLYPTIGNNLLAVLAACLDAHSGAKVHFFEYDWEFGTYVELAP